jgi:hypothetical protein
MSSIFELNKEIDEIGERINLDDLYEKKKESDLNKLANYKKILQRIHIKIKTTSRQKDSEQLCWYVVPETILGVPNYDNAACIAFVLDKLQDNGFMVKYIHPNLIIISWKHWVPGYVRSEIKRKTGFSVDGFGEVLNPDEGAIEEKDPNNIIFTSNKVDKDKKTDKNKEFKSITTYKPTGSIYSNEVLSKFSK